MFVCLFEILMEKSHPIVQLQLIILISHSTFVRFLLSSEQPSLSNHESANRQSVAAWLGARIAHHAPSVLHRAPARRLDVTWLSAHCALVETLTSISGDDPYGISLLLLSLLSTACRMEIDVEQLHTKSLSEGDERSISALGMHPYRLIALRRRALRIYRRTEQLVAQRIAVARVRWPMALKSFLPVLASRLCWN